MLPADREIVVLFVVVVTHFFCLFFYVFDHYWLVFLLVVYQFDNFGKMYARPDASVGAVEVNGVVDTSLLFCSWLDLQAHFESVPCDDVDIRNGPGLGERKVTYVRYESWGDPSIIETDVEVSLLHVYEEV